ncbi:ABC transporter ATP-binding protein [Solibaculum mannosilyticum]|uniref:ABC transporter domain-containing protein n=1 Tax=Solibaculum mannosilyticum TaxID=2780922 RepID=A0A7I8D500_9FIRM|nr:ATP-binding cassette domain-containing protein [Solibaculum mannosilyticum]BCI59724.1 hypothetical protein C12CBH8_03630 [Solibaculum mannosilyticum]
MLAAISLVNYTFSYPKLDAPTLRDITLEIGEGEFVLLCGPTGSGKTTLLRSMKREIAPVGKAQGTVLIQGEDRDQKRKTVSAMEVGYVAQSPDNQLVMDTVWHELSFGLENMGLPPHVIRRRMAETANFFGIESWADRKVYELSGGQKQILNLAAVMAMQPRILLLDEPTAQLDPIAAKQFLQILKRINEELGTTVVLSEHRMEDVLPLCSSVLFLQQGKIRHYSSPSAFVASLLKEDHPFAKAFPASVHIAKGLGERERFPLSVKDGRLWLKEKGWKKGSAGSVPQPDMYPAGKPVLQAKEVWFRYRKEEDFVLRDASIAFYPREVHAIVGGNGSGKSTLLHLLSGAVKPNRGKIHRRDGVRPGLLPQNPKALFTADTVKEELAEWKQNFQYTDGDIDRVMDEMGISHLAGRHPYDLSGGEMQKTALAKVLLLCPTVLLLDEPTKGVDAMAKEELLHILRRQKEEGRTVVLVTHDLEFAARLCDRCSMLFQNGIACSDQGKAFFEQNAFYTTDCNRMTRGLAPGCVTVEDVTAHDR